MIQSCITKERPLHEIAGLLGKDPTTISKEVKRNRTLKRERFPYCCNGSTKQYGTCKLSLYLYNAEEAEKKTKERLVNSRAGLKATEEEFQKIDEIVTNGLKEKQSIYLLVKSNDGMPSASTLYR